MSRGLTPKQEKFCLEYLECGNASKAYRASYTTDKMKDATIHRKAYELLQNGKIAARIDGLRAESAKIAVLTQATVISDLIRVKDHAMTLNPEGQMLRPDTAVRALELLGKHVQAWQPETQIGIQINGNGPSFEEALEKVMVITIRGGMPDSEETLQKEKDALTGRLYSLWKNGQPLPETVTAGGLPDDLFMDIHP
ncbi:MAG: terminase small subunit [Nitrospirae bacterium]|nr:terminase small subunit [Nitrospirota bacterium]